VPRREHGAVFLAVNEQSTKANQLRTMTGKGKNGSFGKDDAHRHTSCSTVDAERIVAKIDDGSWTGVRSSAWWRFKAKTVASVLRVVYQRRGSGEEGVG
jgi:hypothetical protein